MSDTRPLSTPKDHRESVWSLTARINHAYALLHGYGFAYYQVDGACVHLQHGARDASWCKVIALAHALLHGVGGRRCDRMLYLDTDAHVANVALSVDAFLERARLRGDDALAAGADDSWLLLFASNFWFEPDSINAGVFIVRGGAAASRSCGLLRRWWDAAFDVRSHLAEQEPMESMYTQLFSIGKSQRGNGSTTSRAEVTQQWHAAWGSQVRLMPTARFFRRNDSQWSGGGWGAWAAASWERLVAKAPGMGGQYSEDDFVHHGVRRACCAALGTLRRLHTLLATDGAANKTNAASFEDASAAGASDAGQHSASQTLASTAIPTVLISGQALSDVFRGRESDCPPGQPLPGTPTLFDSARLVRGHSARWAAANVRRRNQTDTGLDGSRTSSSRRPCWKTVDGPWVPPQRAVWTC